MEDLTWMGSSPRGYLFFYAFDAALLEEIARSIDVVVEGDSVANERGNRVSAKKRVEKWKLVDDGFDLSEVGHTALLEPLESANKRRKYTSRDSPLIRYNAKVISTRAR